MTSQIPFTPLTPEAMERLTMDEVLAFEAAACAVAGDQKPSLEVVATLVLTVQRLISEAPGSTLPVPAPDDTGRDLPAAPEQPRERTGADPRESGYSRADLEYAPPDPEHEALAASLPQEWVKAAKGWYSMHGSGLVRNLLAGAVPLIQAAERERIRQLAIAVSKSCACESCKSFIAGLIREPQERSDDKEGRRP